MVKEVKQDGQLNHAAEPEISFDAADLEINEETFHPFDASMRPPGWQGIRMKRILAKEQLMGADRELILATRPHRELEVITIVIFIYMIF
jgi:hypothetical protein